MSVARRRESEGWEGACVSLCVCVLGSMRMCLCVCSVCLCAFVSASSCLLVRLYLCVSTV